MGYRILSSDGHPVASKTTFTLTTAARAPRPSRPRPCRPPGRRLSRLPIWAPRPPRPRRTAARGWPCSGSSGPSSCWAAPPSWRCAVRESRRPRDDRHP
ncbi:hypothetical protein ACFQX6_60820 [Streptosporangium lutulentum]